MPHPQFIQEDNTLYRVEGYVSEQDILEQSEFLLLKRLQNGEPVRNPADTTNFFQHSLADKCNRHFSALFLNADHVVIAYEKLLEGSLDEMSIYPRIVVQRALYYNAAAVIFAQNRPSRSRFTVLDRFLDNSEVHVTKDLVRALSLIDVEVLGHFAVFPDGWEVIEPEPDG